MEEFIRLAASQLGVGEDSIRKATSVLLGLFNSQGEGGAGGSLLAALPGAAEMAGGGESGGGGLLGALGSAVGGQLGDAAGVMSQLQGSGLGTDQLGKFGELFVSFAREKAGAGVVDQALASVPQLKSLLG